MISFICAIPQEPDDKAFMLSLYDSYYKLMYSIAYKYVSDIQTVDDIVQDSIVSLYGKIDILKPMPDKVLAGYIVSTVRNTAINRLRVKEYEKDHIAEFTEENVSGADRYVPMETLLILAERRKALLDIWPVLPKETQILLKGKYILGYTDQELACQLSRKQYIIQSFGTIRFTAVGKETSIPQLFKSLFLRGSKLLLRLFHDAFISNSFSYSFVSPECSQPYTCIVRIQRRMSKIIIRSRAYRYCTALRHTTI